MFIDRWVKKPVEQNQFPMNRRFIVKSLSIPPH